MTTLLVYAPRELEKDTHSSPAFRVWISEPGDEQCFVCEGLTSAEDALKSLHEDIEGYLEILS